jgi:hypothetical protein
MENNTEKYRTPIVKAYGKALPDDEIRYIMVRTIPPEWKEIIGTWQRALEI